MPQITAQRVFLTILLMGAFSCAGVFAGYMTGTEITIRSAQQKLNRYAANIMTRAEASSAESRMVLEEMNASTYSFCSDQELMYLRKLAFESEYLKELARVRSGKIICSAMLGRLPAPLGLPNPVVTQKDETQIYPHISSFHMENYELLGLQLHDSLVVFRPHTLMDLNASPFHYSVVVPASSGTDFASIFGDKLQIHPDLLIRDGEGKDGQTLYATRCSNRFFNCLVAYTTVPEVIQVNTSNMAGFIVMGGLIGLGCGFVTLLLYFRRMSPKQQLQRAIREDQLHVVYQPIIHLSDQRLVGAEALVRWTDRDGVPQNPEVFVKLAEESGLIWNLTERVLRHAIRDMSKLMRAYPDFKVNINISASDLSNPQFASLLQHLLRRARILPGNIGLELTERSTADHEIALSAILALRSFGYSIFIDDFGTGYSSLSYLHELAVDGIKIDRSFTNAIATEAVISSILPQILEMAKSLNLKVVVEGIETKEQANYFQINFPDACAQGWLLGRPIPAEEFYKIYAQPKKASKSLVHSSQ